LANNGIVDSPIVPRMRARTGLFALLGLVAAAFGIAVGTLVAALHDPAYGPIQVVASSAIDIPPAPVKEWATSTFGTSAKYVVVGSVVVGVVALSLAAGVLARRYRWWGAALLALVGLVGVAAGLRRPTSDPLAALPSLIAGIVAGCALLLLVWLARWRHQETQRPPIEGEGDGLPVDQAAGSIPSINRRALLLGVGSLVVVGGASLMAARYLTDRASAVASRVKALLPTPTDPLAPLPASVQAPVPGMTPFVTPNPDFYRIDTAVIVPQVPAETWSLTIDGMVEAPLTITYAELLQMPMVERDITIMCVSNPVGGPYIGTARWLGTPLVPLLERAGVMGGADQLLSTSIDGWTCSTPLDGLAEREPLLAIGMNGEALPIEHGFPVRMIVPGLYGFISATKWVTRIQATTYAAEPAYWTVRGWATDAPVLTNSRIDLPGGAITAGPVQLAGVAWAMDGDGITRVEVQIDAGPWQDANLADEPNARTWRQWWLDWDATPGEHLITVRATNGLGEVQTSEVRDVIPSGATGYDSRLIQVS
jgi:DMSO/TMAO reductase YedYZ molybdopterin-dependent catalytic subunit